MKLTWVDYVAIIMTIIAVVLGLVLVLHTMQDAMVNCTVENPCNVTSSLYERLRSL